jgi:hypothetical protein
MRNRAVSLFEKQAPTGRRGRRNAGCQKEWCVAGSLIVVDFRLFPSGHAMPASFTLGGIHFAAIDPATPLSVIDTAADRGLVFKTAGLRVGLPGPINGLRLTAGGFAGVVQVLAKDASGATLHTQQVLPTNTFVHVLLNVPGMTQLELVGGNNEGMLLELIVPC